MQAVLLLLPLLAPSGAILPEPTHPGIRLIQHNSLQEEERAAAAVQAEQQTPVQQESNLTTTTAQSTHVDNNIDAVCVTAEDCGKERYCQHDSRDSRCKPCKGVDVSCAEDEECCGLTLCIWGQCSPNATKGQAGGTCRLQAHCGPDLCCAFHAALLFPVCSAKPIERERCFPASKHLNEEDTPRKHCPCAGDLHCQNLGRGSMCLRAVDSSEEALTDSLYSAIDYIL
ncbi:dickkopf-related protein 3a [Syngnathoides biaculeatus]|uniref:dickkopf-related protein 3a n=1 Tax=Syngnathoides biaculeatus TaxID=300417 RepID=UPI002ADE2E9C|nr:dickkopf-related protein 3a [Syngnathoides biaculeatus]